MKKRKIASLLLWSTTMMRLVPASSSSRRLR